MRFLKIVGLQFVTVMVLFGHCTATQQHGEICNADLSCDGSGGLFCSPSANKTLSSVCSCPTGTIWVAAVYYGPFILRQGCKSLVGGNCNYDPMLGPIQQCVPNADCVYSGTEEATQKCACNLHYQPTRYKQCKRGHSFFCENEHECDDTAGLMCIDSYCKCSDSTQIWDINQRKCVSNVGGRCGSIPGHRDYCIEKAYCDNGLCKCSPGYSWSEEQQDCIKKYGERCWTSFQCGRQVSCLSPTMKVLGDRLTLNSMETEENRGVCRCPSDTQVFNESTTICNILVGELWIGFDIPCVYGAHFVDWRCSCVSPFLPTLDKYCSLSSYTTEEDSSPILDSLLNATAVLFG